MRAVLLPLLASAVLARESRVLLLRHCPRAPYPTDRHPPLPPANFSSDDNFSAQAFPSTAVWGAKPGRCTPAGLELSRSFGAALPKVLRAQHAELMADETPRCMDTAAALGLNDTAVKADKILFNPLQAKMASCSQPDWQGTLMDMFRQSQKEFEKARSLLPKLQEILGKGVAPPLPQIPDAVSGGYLVGGLRVASESIVETFDLERTSNVTTAWGRLAEGDFSELSYIRSVYFTAMYGGRDIAQRYASGILAKLLEKELPPATVLLGHDLNLEGVRSLLDIQWQCGMWAENGKPPLGGLMFVISDSAVRIEVLCPSVNTADPVVMGQAKFGGGSAEMPIAEFETKVRSQIVWSCVNSSVTKDERPIYS